MEEEFSTGAVMRMVMKRKPNGFKLKLNFSPDAGALGDSRASEQSWGDMQRSGGGRVEGPAVLL